MVGTSANTSAQLVQLRETKALGIEDDHNRGIGHIHTHFNDRCGYENLRLPLQEPLHLCFFLLGLHLAVHLTQLELREDVAEGHIAFL